MRIRSRYVLPCGGAITLEHIDFGLYTVSFRGKPLKEFCCVDKARVYLDRAIVIALNHARNRAFRKAA